MYDHGDFEAFYVDVRPRLVRSLAVFCGGDLDVAADAADEALVRALERWSRVSTMALPDAWTFTVGRNLVRRRFRRRSTEERLLHSQIEPRTGEFEGRVDDSVTVWAAIAALPEADREALALRYLLGLTEDEVAAVAAQPTGTVSARLARSRRALRRHLGADPW